MAKRRKKIVDKIEVDKSVIKEKVSDNKPPCYGEKEKYCRKDICGEYFDSCKEKLYPF